MRRRAWRKQGLARRRGRELPSDDPALGDSAVGPDALERVSASVDGRRLRECLDTLEEKNRRGILLAFVHGLSHSQVAERLSLPLGTVKTYIHRARHELREALDRAVRAALAGGAARGPRGW